MSGLLQVTVHLIVAVPLWLGVLNLFRRLDRSERLADLATVVSVVPPVVYVGVAALARLGWPVAAAAFLAATVLFGGAIVLLDWLVSLRQRRRTRVQRATAGRDLAATLRRYGEGNLQEEAVELIDRAIDFRPYDRLKMQLLWATTELFALKRSTPVARMGGVPAVMIERVQRVSVVAGDAIWSAVARAAAAAAQGVHTPTVEESVRHEVLRLRRLTNAIIEAREGLAQVTLFGSGSEAELAEAEVQLKLLAETAKDLSESRAWEPR
ncbi:MAG: hypothetical protein ACYC5O_11170 [Anaerolineae bacterium]